MNCCEVIVPIVLCVLCALSYFAEWVHLRRYDSRLWWTLERIRSCVAGSGDPGPWKGEQP